MQRVRLLAPLTFGPGTLLGLSATQARRRAHGGVLEPAGEGMWRTLAHASFKAGEELALQDLPRCFEAAIELLDGELVDPSAPAGAPAPRKPAVKRAPKRA
jgi:hypothetical protein